MRITRTREAFLSLALAVLGSGCAASEYYDAAVKMRPTDPHASIEYVALCLKESPENEKALDFVRDISDRVREEHKARISEMEGSKKYDDAVAECDRVIASARIVADLPGGVQIYYDPDERTRFARLAARQHRDEGVAFETAGNTKEAAIAFRRALAFKANDTDALARYQKAQKSSTVKVAVVPFACAEDRSLGESLARGTKVACLALKPEFLILADRHDETCNGKVAVNLTARFEDSGWVPHAGTNEITKRRADSNGVQRDVRLTCQYTVHERTHRFHLAAAGTVEGKDGASLAALSAEHEAGDTARYLQMTGEEEALPDDLKNLPRAPNSPKGRAELRDACATEVGNALGNQLFKAFK